MNTFGLSWTMPASAYRDPLQFARERSRIFARNWALFTWSERLAHPGSYVAGTLAGYPIFLIRDTDGCIHGFHNVCRHRAATLFAEEEGRCTSRAIVCPYHRWTYDFSGRLLKATDFGNRAHPDPEEWRLTEIDVAEWRGLVFARLERGGPELKSWLGPIDTMAADYPLESQHFFSARTRDVAVDWKAYAENYLECYHCRGMHPGLCAAMDIDQYRIDVQRDNWLFHLYAPRREGGLTRGLYFYRFPFLMLNLYDWGSSIATIEPAGAGQVRHINWYFSQDISPEKTEENQRSVDWSAQIVTEDLAILVGVQRNLNAGIYHRGPLSPKYEHAVLAFQDMVRAALDDGGNIQAAAE